jgi:hypothetical protein
LFGFYKEGIGWTVIQQFWNLDIYCNWMKRIWRLVFEENIIRCRILKIIGIESEKWNEGDYAELRKLGEDDKKLIWTMLKGQVKDNCFGKQLTKTLMLTEWLLVLMILENKSEGYINLCSLKDLIGKMQDSGTREIGEEFEKSGLMDWKLQLGDKAVAINKPTASDMRKYLF